ncbi:hypothetical protein U1Q18_014170 [Sarracenia purpurea var. burkii]
MVDVLSLERAVEGFLQRSIGVAGGARPATAADPHSSGFEGLLSHRNPSPPHPLLLCRVHCRASPLPPLLTKPLRAFLVLYNSPALERSSASLSYRLLRPDLREVLRFHRP